MADGDFPLYETDIYTPPDKLNVEETSSRKVNAGRKKSDTGRVHRINKLLGISNVILLFIVAALVVAVIIDFQPQQFDVRKQNCTNEYTCVCPERLPVTVDDCVCPEEPGCSDPEIGVIPEGVRSSNSNCSKRCSCEDNQLTCDGSYQCDENAFCDVRNSTRGCYCRSGYRGDGTTCTRAIPRDCYDVYTSGSAHDGIYTIRPSGWPGTDFQVYCNMSNGGGWTVFQRRQDGSVDFYQDWATYKAGFGTLTTEFWLGNEKLYYLVKQKAYELRIDIVNRDWVKYNMNYDSIQISNETDDYRLILGTFTGNTGFDYMSNHRGMAFSAHDNDNDNYDHNCAYGNGGGWWYNNCYTANLNGNYNITSIGGVALYIYSGTHQFSLRYTEMKIRPA